MAATETLRVSARRAHRLAERGVDRHAVVAAAGVVFVLALFVYPFFYGIAAVVPARGEGGGLFANYCFFADPYQRDTSA